MNQPIPIVYLRDVCKFLSGGTPSKSVSKYWNGCYPWVSPKDMQSIVIVDAQDHISEEAISGSAARLVPAGTILIVVRSGILSWRVPIAITRRDVAFNQDIKAIVVDGEKALPEFITYFIRSREAAILANGVKKGATVHSLVSGYLENMKLSLPPLSEQRRIVDILDRAASIERLRTQADAKTTEIVPALFVDMFGDPAKNPKGWKVCQFGELITYSKYGPRFPKGAYASGGAHVLRTTDMDNEGGLRWWEAPTIKLTNEELLQHALKPNTLLVTRTGTIGRLAVFRGATHPCIAGAYLIEFGLGENLTADYTEALFLSYEIQRQLKGGSQSMTLANLNAPTIKAIQIMCPPKALQTEFANRVAALNGLKQCADSAAKLSGNVQASLMNQLG